MTEHSGVLDPGRRVNYRLGLVLGETEFRQDEDHHRERTHQHHRALHGYGTVCGLAVRWTDDGQIAVEPGLAIDPAGRLICVPRTNCAVVDEWLESHLDEVREASADGAVTLAVELCWRECATDLVPLPTEECRSDTDSSVPSRIAESFELRLRAVRDGEDADPGDDGDGAPASAALGEAGAAAGAVAWVTQGHPAIAAADACLTARPPSCVPLARVRIPLTDSDPPQVADAPDVTAAARPVLLPTAMLQALLLELLDRGVGPLDGLDDVDAGDAAEGQVLAFGDGRWGPVDPSEPSLAGRAGGDLDGRYPDPTVVALAGHRVAADAPAPGDALVSDGENWRPRPVVAAAPGGAAVIAAAGAFDLDGRASGPTIGDLQVVEVTTDQLDLSFDGYRAPDDDRSYVVTAGVRLASRGSAPVPTIGTRLLGDVVRLELDWGEREPDTDQRGRVSVMVQILRIGEGRR
jgi:hypothetical protein